MPKRLKKGGGGEDRVQQRQDWRLGSQIVTNFNIKPKGTRLVLIKFFNLKKKNSKKFSTIESSTNEWVAFQKCIPESNLFIRPIKLAWVPS